MVKYITTNLTILPVGCFVLLNTDQILSLAPDASSAKAGSQLAAAAKWDKLGRSDVAVWGECKGSGKDPYRTQIDLGEPAFKCSCPSRKFPCKHGLALYLLLAENNGLFTQMQAPAWVSDWLHDRQQRADKKRTAATEPPAAQNEEQVAASAVSNRKRVEKRENKVAAGMAALETWLHDLEREGLATVRDRGPAYWEAMAARLVDAQAAGLAGRIRRAGKLCFQSGVQDWSAQLARELASIYMLGVAYARLEQLPPGLQHDVRTSIGWTTSSDEVLALAGVSDCWQVLSQQHGEEDRIRTRATWLRGQRSARWALLLHFAAGPQGFEQAISAGTQFEGELCFYPGACPLRALIKESGTTLPLAMFPAEQPSFLDAMDSYADALAAQPFLERYPLALTGVTAHMQETGLLLRCPDGNLLPVSASFRHAWQLLAVSGGAPVTLTGEWDGRAFSPWSVWADGRLYNFESDFCA